MSVAGFPMICKESREQWHSELAQRALVHYLVCGFLSKEGHDDEFIARHWDNQAWRYATRAFWPDGFAEHVKKEVGE